MLRYRTEHDNKKAILMFRDMRFDGRKRRKWKTATQIRHYNLKIQILCGMKRWKNNSNKNPVHTLQIEMFLQQGKKQKDQADTGTKTTMEQKGGTKEEEEGERSGMED